MTQYKSRLEKALYAGKRALAGLTLMAMTGCASPWPPTQTARPNGIMSISINSNPPGAEIWSESKKAPGIYDMYFGERMLIFDTRNGSYLVGTTPYKATCKIYERETGMNSLVRHFEACIKGTGKSSALLHKETKNIDWVVGGQYGASLLCRFVLRKKGYKSKKVEEQMQTAKQRQNFGFGIGVSSIGAQKDLWKNLRGSRNYEWCYDLEPKMKYQQSKQTEKPTQDPTEQLLKLKKLLDAKILTKEEYETKRKALVDRL